MALSRHGSGVIVVALTLALSGCGSTDGKPTPAAAPQGADPVVWAGTFCSGLGDVITGVSAMAKAQPTPQGQKDGLLQFSDTVQRAFAHTAHQLQVLGAPRVTDSKRIQDTAVNFFITAAQTVGDQRTRFAALDAKDPDFVQKASHLAGPDLSAASTQIRELTNNKELAPAFAAAPACQQLRVAGGGGIAGPAGGHR
jgi:phage baseplate assembly protein gpV